jgi:hypothetical protein
MDTTFVSHQGKFRGGDSTYHLDIRLQRKTFWEKKSASAIKDSGRGKAQADFFPKFFPLFLADGFSRNIMRCSRQS